MAPLVPQLLSPEFNLVIAFIVGIGFGFALEQAGFSSTRKLVGLFYGYDFTVLKVFFTAGVTAMSGVLFLGHVGLLDLSLIYINPTFLWSALIGGAIMGVGFILGGFCPGTSLCAAAVGRLDAFAFIGGSILGVLAFTEAYPLIEPLYTAQPMGDITFYELLDISPVLFGLIITLIAIFAFWATSKIEDNVNDTTSHMAPATMLKYSLTALVPLLIIAFVWITPDKKTRIINRVEEVATAKTVSLESMSVDKLAFELINHTHKYNVIDVRDSAAFNVGTIPSAIHIPEEQLYDRSWRSMYRQPYKTNIFIGENTEQVYKAAMLARELGDKDPVILESSVGHFRELIFNAAKPEGDVSKQQLNRYKFRNDAAKQLKEIEERLKNSVKPPKRVFKKVEGGCA